MRSEGFSFNCGGLGGVCVHSLFRPATARGPYGRAAAKREGGLEGEGEGVREAGERANGVERG